MPAEKHRILIKIGGRAFAGEHGFKELAHAIKSLRDLELIVVHGGGAEISRALKDANRETEFIDGIRVTRSEDIRIVESVLSETVNRRIASWLEGSDLKCRRMSGKTEKLFLARPLKRGGLDWGYVGEIEAINTAVVFKALAAGQVPIISPISGDESGASYNVNADSAAGALAAAADCTDLVFITDVPGVMVDGKTRPALSVEEARSLIANGIINGGMVAKMESVFDALAKQVPRVHIIQWQGAETLSGLINNTLQHGTVIHSG
jgi:acetylglutamate kinase